MENFAFTFTFRRLMLCNCLCNRHNYDVCNNLTFTQEGMIHKSCALTEHHAMKAYWGSGSTHSLTSVLGGGEWSASRPGHFTPRQRAPGTHWIGDRAVLNAVVKGKIPSPLRESNPRTPTVQPVAQRYTDWAIMALFTRAKQPRIRVFIFCG
jgi:hypothetical protein